MKVFSYQPRHIDNGLGAQIGFENNTNPVEVIDPASPLAAGVSGTFNAYSEPRYITWETDLSANPTVVVTRPSQPTQAVVFAYESGDTMTSRFATTRHVSLGYHRDGLAVGLTTEATNQLLAAVTWAQATTYIAPPPPSAPTNVVASASNEQATISWDSVSSADSYTIKRSTTDGGPYTTIETNITTTSYTDTNLTNGTTYYYVISATNAQGESPDSTQVSATPVEGGGGPVTGQLALLVTNEELAMWQDRAQNGPFRVAGDFSANSPGHWTEMQACMSLDFASARWSGPTNLDSDGKVLRGGTTNDPPGNVRRMAHDMMSAAYAAMVTDNTTVAQAITAEIEHQATRTNLNFGNRTLYPFDYYDDLNPLFMYCVWVKDYVLAYDVCKGMGYSSTTVEQWFLNLAELSEQIVRANMELRFPTRSTNNYTNRTSWSTTDLREVHRIANGNIIPVPLILLKFNNRRSNQAGLFGLVGTLLNNTYYIDEFKRYMREWLMFGNRTTTYGGIQDANRGTNSFPQLGFSYSLHGLESCLPAMDALARQGDTELYEFSSSDGATQPTWGTDHFKTMEQCIDGRLRWISQEWPLQYTGDGEPPTSSVAGNSYYLVQAMNTGNGNAIVNDANFMYAANYYNRPDWVDIINRVGTPTGFTFTPQGVGGITGWRADWRNRFLRSIDANPYL